MTAFSDLSQTTRMDIRRKVCDLGGEIGEYHGDGVTVRLARGFTSEIETVFQTIGFVSQDQWYFPLGSDKTPEILRWDGSYPRSKGFTCTAFFVQGYRIGAGSTSGLAPLFTP